MNDLKAERDTGNGVRRFLFWLKFLFLFGCGAALILPVLVKPRYSQRPPCPNNLKQIGLGLKMYAGDHGERFPDKMVEARQYVGHQSALFVCPPAYRHHGSGSKPGPIETVDEWTDYVYVSGLSETNAPDTVLMYCPAKNHNNEGGNILFLDGHVEWFNAKGNTRGETDFEEIIGTIREKSEP